MFSSFSSKTTIVLLPAIYQPFNIVTMKMLLHFTTELILEYTLQTGPTYGAKHEIHNNGSNKAFKIQNYSARFNSSCNVLLLFLPHVSSFEMVSWTTYKYGKSTKSLL